MVHVNILWVVLTIGLVIKQEIRPLFSNEPRVADIIGSVCIVSGNRLFSRSILEAISNEWLTLVNRPSAAVDGVESLSKNLSATA